MREAVVRTPSELCPALAVGPAGSFEDCAVRHVDVLGRVDRGHLFDVTFARAVGDELASADAVRSVQRLDGSGDEYRYVVHVVPSIDGRTESGADEPALLDSVAVDGNGITHTLVGDESALSRTVSWFDSLVDGVELCRFAEYGGDDGVGASLTDRQRTTLAAAFELGYYEVPRDATAEDVAEHLELDRSTVTEHLQRAERRLVSAAVSE